MIPELSGDYVQWLRGFYYTVKTGSLTAATEIMHRNQSAITYQIQSLENMYGVPLFMKGKGKRELTEEGKFLYTKTIELFSEIDSIRPEINQASRGTVGEIKIAASNSILEYYLPEYVARFRERCPGASFILEGVTELQTALQMLASRQVDFGIVFLRNIPDYFETTPLFSSGIVLITPKTGPYAFTEARLEYLMDIPFITPRHGSSVDVDLRAQLTRMGLELHREILSASTSGAKQFVGQGLGVAFIRAFAIDEEDRDQFNIVPLEPLLKPMDYGIVQRRGMAMSTLCEEFLRCLGETDAYESPPASIGSGEDRDYDS